MLVEGVYCRQSTHYSCGPAAAVSALAHLNVPASKGELVIHAYTSPVTGIDGDLLADAINRRYGNNRIEAQATLCRSIDDLKKRALPSFKLSTASGWITSWSS